ncbi:hypothetical protein BRADI_2g62092v3 [Brachypodium distachyon]|uniref:F-box domain-containing protein n=1 Tax=Brachypodium distachyon TaxID=15368 RepID=A0A0Q3GMQ9_BRADI|nr:hypothetical protein BRADI_2g62092v3 [Brachypodium distachyon]
MEDTAAPLPDDMVLEILVRLKDDAAALFRCAAACKRWHRLVAGPSFLRRCWPEPPPSLAGFCGNEQRDGQELCFVLYRRVALNPCPQILRRPGRLRRSVTRFEANYKAGYAVLACADCPSSTNDPSTSFRVAVVVSSDDDWDDHEFALHTFSSTTSGSGGGGESARWSTPRTERFEHEYAGGGNYEPFCQRDAIVCHGTARWLFSDRSATCFRAVQVDVETGHFSSTKLASFPMRYLSSHPCVRLADADGALSLLWVRGRSDPRPRLEIWALQDDRADENASDQAASEKWLCTKTVELRRPEDEDEEANRDLVGVLGEKCGKLLVTDSRCHVYAADLGTGTMEEVAGRPRGCLFTREDAVPLEMDWPAMFVSRLGSGRHLDMI